VRICFVIVFLTIVPAVYAQGGVCPVNAGPLPDEQWLVQGRCLLRTVKMNRELGPGLTELPAPLDDFIGRTVAVDRDVLRRYLREHRIDESHLGGKHAAREMVDSRFSRGH